MHRPLSRLNLRRVAAIAGAVAMLAACGVKGPLRLPAPAAAPPASTATPPAPATAPAKPADSSASPAAQQATDPAGSKQ